MVGFSNDQMIWNISWKPFGIINCLRQTTLEFLNLKESFWILSGQKWNLHRKSHMFRAKMLNIQNKIISSSWRKREESKPLFLSSRFRFVPLAIETSFGISLKVSFFFFIKDQKSGQIAKPNYILMDSKYCCKYQFN